MIKAKFSHRDYTPEGHMTLDITAVQFSGEEEIVESLDTIRKTVEFDRSRLRDYEVGFIANQRQGKQVEINDVKRQLLELKSGNRFLKFKKGEAYSEYVRLNAMLEELLAEDRSMVSHIEELDEDRFYTAKELRERFSSMLSGLGFVSTGSSTAKNGITTELMESAVPDEEIKRMAAEMIAHLEEQISEQRAAIQNKYLPDHIVTDIPAFVFDENEMNTRDGM